MSADGLPSYAELAARTDAPAGTSWGLFGPHDQLGTLNFLTPERVRASARLVEQGEVHPLNWPIELPDPAPFRKPPIRTQTGDTWGRDDYLDRFYLQGSSQWDGLRHIAHPRYGFYNHTTAAQVDDPANDRLGIQVMARRGIVGRGVLLDVARYCAEHGQPFAPNARFVIDVALLEAVAAAERVTIEPGDLLLVRTGWTGWYSAAPVEDRVAASSVRLGQPGLECSERTVAWLWDQRVAAIAADNLALEPMPLDFRLGSSLHFWLIPCLGMPIGELWWLDDLAAACAADRRWVFQLVSAPLNVRGGVGSPPNALAIR
jgi:kynurenine formamidase